MNNYDIRVGILTTSDKGSKGEREDKSGDSLERRLESAGFRVVRREVVPDELDEIKKVLFDWCGNEMDIVFTTGGTGFSPRDVTPEATLSVIDRNAPGIAEAMRIAGLKHTKKAMLSRGVSGIRNETLIVNLPGSEKGALESLEAVLEVLPHAVEVIRGDAGDCGG